MRDKIIFLLIFFIFCQKKEEVYIQGWVSKMEFTKDDVRYFQEVVVYNYKGFKMIPKVFINDLLLPLINEPFTYAFYGNYLPFESGKNYKLKIEHEVGNAYSEVFMPKDFEILYPKEETIIKNFYGNYLPFESGKNYKLKIEHEGGNAYSEVFMPKDFEILYPKEETIIKKSELPFKVIWQKSEGASWYEVVIWIEYDFLYPNGEDDDFTFSLDTVLKDTFLIIDAQRIFPGYVAEILSGEGNITVYSGTGPALKPGEKGNIKGFGYGFFNALYSPEDHTFYIEAEPKVKKLSFRKEKILEKLKNR